MRRWKQDCCSEWLHDEFGEFPPISGFEAYAFLGPRTRDSVDISGQLTRYAWLRRKGWTLDVGRAHVRS